MDTLTSEFYSSKESDQSQGNGSNKKADGSSADNEKKNKEDNQESSSNDVSSQSESEVDNQNDVDINPRETECASPLEQLDYRGAEGEFGEEDRRYNCHFFAWNTDEDDPTALGYENFCKKYRIKGDRSVTPHSKRKRPVAPSRRILRKYVQVPPGEPIEVGDRVLYFDDLDGDGNYDPSRSSVDVAYHSAIVSKVVDGKVDEVVSQAGGMGVRYNHPSNPTLYGEGVTRVYYRRIK